MARVDPLPEDEPASVTSADVADSCSAACWSVEERAWKQDLPDLPDDVIALLAPPVVVTAAARPANRAPNRGTRPAQVRRPRRLVDTVEP